MKEKEIEIEQEKEKEESSGSIFITSNNYQENSQPKLIQKRKVLLNTTHKITKKLNADLEGLEEVKDLNDKNTLITQFYQKVPLSKTRNKANSKRINQLPNIDTKTKGKFTKAVI